MNYYEIPTKSTITQNLLDIATNNDPWVFYYSFNTKIVPQDLILTEPFFQWLNNKHEFKAGLLKLNPFVCYDWHVDTRRGASINMLVNTDAKSNCFFSDSKKGYVFNIEQLDYKSDTYYAFNSQTPHTVYNFDKPRYLLSIEFTKEKSELSFNQLVKDIQEYYEVL